MFPVVCQSELLAHLVDTVTAARYPGIPGARPDGGAARHGLRSVPGSSPAQARHLPGRGVDLAVVVVLVAHSRLLHLHPRLGKVPGLKEFVI